MKYTSGLQKVFEIQSKIEDIHPFLEKVFPIAIVEDNHFFVFDTDSSGKRYIFAKEALTQMPIPKRVRAAFPLDCYEGRLACVISGEIFESLEGYATIFHEFIHCHQSEICEHNLKQKLEIARKAMAEKDYMWEINYPFPYDNPKFTEIYSLFLRALEKNKSDEVFKYRSQLKQILSKDNLEYMVWQEWKEGFARFIENQIRRRLGLKENHYGMEKPLHRVSFYEGGARFIAFLSTQEPKLLVDIEKLFYEMSNSKR
ncbi:MAG: hypothetical protein J7M27_13680 [Candidatus Latescibacteria bacterium]|nr:hypothetical protein [Candidatus Latescibacterota bacterium]